MTDLINTLNKNRSIDLNDSLEKYFPRYTEYNPTVKVWCLTNGDGCYTHRFFNTDPLSPTGRYIALLDMPYEDKDAEPFDTANIVVIDLHTGEEKIVYKTKGWQHQMGANINWGVDDNSLIFTDVDLDDLENITAYSVNLNPSTGEFKRLSHEVYHVSPDGRYGVSGNLIGATKTQYGYGVSVPEGKIPFTTINTDDDGMYIIDTQTGELKLLLSLKEIFDRTHTELEKSFLQDGVCYVFHTKWSPTNDKIMFSTRWAPNEYKHLNDLGAHKDSPLKFCIFTCNTDGSELEVAIDQSQWCKIGLHTIWHPNGKYLTLNLNLELKGLRLCKASLKGRHIEKLSETIHGSGHPSFHPHKNFMIVDTYEVEEYSYCDGTVPIRLIDFDKHIELPPPIRINIAHEGSKISPKYRVDPHVVWCKDGRYCVFNGHTNGHRRVFIADMSPLV